MISSAWLNAKSTRTVGKPEANSVEVSVYELGGRLQVKILSRSPFCTGLARFFSPHPLRHLLGVVSRCILFAVRARTKAGDSPAFIHNLASRARQHSI